LSDGQTWVQQHLNSPFSTVVIYKYINGGFFDPSTDEKASAFHQLTPAARNNKVGTILAAWLH